MHSGSIKSPTHIHDEPKPKRINSDVWDSFEKLPTSAKEDPKVQCKFCKNFYTYKSSGDTSHLCRLISKCPRRAFRDIKQCIGFFYCI